MAAFFAWSWGESDFSAGSVVSVKLADFFRRN
jgi:hypothetical protein